MTGTWTAVALSLVLAGCSSWGLTNPFGGPSTMLAKADRLTAEGDYKSAVAAYDAFLAQYSDDSQAVRARRDAVASIMTTRDEISRLNQKLRADLERLKQIDLQLEKRK